MANVGSVNGKLQSTALGADGICYADATGLIQVTAAGTAAQVLTSNGAGVAPTYQTTKVLSVVRQVFTSTGTYTPTAGMVYCDIIAIGGGGAGGGAAATAGNTTSVAGGGGAGEYAQGTFSAATIGASQSVTIGAAGTGNSGATGGNGGNTSVGSTLISANGGSGGIAGTAGGNCNANGGAGGTGGTGGDFRTPGQSGSWGYSAASAAVNILTAGYGGSSQYGAGGASTVTGVSNQGAAGLGFGAGGAGSCNFTSQTALLGGAGTKGVVIVTEYVFT